MPLAPSRASDETNTMLRYLDISSIKPHFVPGLWEWRHGQLRKGVKSTRCYSEGICSEKKKLRGGELRSCANYFALARKCKIPGIAEHEKLLVYPSANLSYKSLRIKSICISMRQSYFSATEHETKFLHFCNRPLENNKGSRATRLRSAIL